MKTAEFDYFLPKNLIAQKPLKKRDQSRLLVLDKKTGRTKDEKFCDIINFLKKGDVLVLNNSKVFPARLTGNKEDTGGKVEIFLHKNFSKNEWKVIGKKLKIGDKIVFSNSKLKAKVISKNDQIYNVIFNLDKEELLKEAEAIGQVPLPPYIKRKEVDFSDKKNYQTVYAKNIGSVAAPTAGFHFTKEMIKKIKSIKVEIVEVTLHVGLGTFAPVKASNVSSHKIHSEYYSVEKEALSKIIKAKKENHRVIAVGTTSTRVLETTFNKLSDHQDQNTILSGWTNIFIYPSYKFKCIDGLITNFHLPKSTLLMLVSAFAGKDRVLGAYKEAVDKKYRFYSYGDAMLIL